MPDVVLPSPMPLPCLTQLRQETASRLRTLPGVFQGVYDSRLPQMKRELLPAVRVYTSRGQPRALDQHPRVPHHGVPGRPDHLRGQQRRRARRAHRPLLRHRQGSPAERRRLAADLRARAHHRDRVRPAGRGRVAPHHRDARPSASNTPRPGSPYVPDWLETVRHQHRRDRPGRRPQHRRARHAAERRGRLSRRLSRPRWPQSKPSSSSSIRNRRRAGPRRRPPYPLTKGADHGRLVRAHPRQYPRAAVLRRDQQPRGRRTSSCSSRRS